MGYNPCRQLWDSPQINWDGRLLGCCVPADFDFEVNVFKTELLQALNSRDYLATKQLVCGQKVNNIAIFPHEHTTVGGRKVNIYNAIMKSKNTVKIVVKGSCATRKHVVIQKNVWVAIQAYIENDGFAGLKLSVYLDRIFERPVAQ